MSEYKNTKGSALVWVLVICTIFGILGLSIGWVALSMHQRSLENNQKSQVYLSARSGADLLFDYLNADPNQYALSKALRGELIQGTSHTVAYDDIFSENTVTDGSTLANMGKCKVEASYDGKTVTIQSTATLSLNASTTNNTEIQKETLQLTAKRKTAEDNYWPAPLWAKQQLMGSSASWQIGSVADRPADSGATDFVVYKVEEENISGAINIVSDAKISASKPSEQLENTAIFIYINDSKSLTLTDITGWDKEYGPDIFIYVGSNATLSLEGRTETYPFYITVGSGGKVQSSNTQNAKVYVVSGGDASSITNIEQDTDKNVPHRLPHSGYDYNGKPYADDGESTTKGAKASLWEKGMYTVITQEN